jgi:hypothetical protein
MSLSITVADNDDDDGPLFVVWRVISVSSSLVVLVGLMRSS